MADLAQVGRSSRGFSGTMMRNRGPRPGPAHRPGSKKLFALIAGPTGCSGIPRPRCGSTPRGFGSTPRTPSCRSARRCCTGIGASRRRPNRAGGRSWGSSAEKFARMDMGIDEHLTLRNLVAVAAERGNAEEEARLRRAGARRVPRRPRGTGRAGAARRRPRGDARALIAARSASGRDWEACEPTAGEGPSASGPSGSDRDGGREGGGRGPDPAAGGESRGHQRRSIHPGFANFSASSEGRRAIGHWRAASESRPGQGKGPGLMASTRTGRGRSRLQRNSGWGRPRW